MKIGITDSGTGGLAVCAEVEARLREQPSLQDVELLYLNAALRDDFSYNAMTTREEKVQAFDRFLENVRARYAPDFLYIACNTLSILFKDEIFRQHAPTPTRGIVESGTRAILAALQSHDESSRTAPIVIFATPTTVSEGAYVTAMTRAGVARGRVIQQACPGLPDAISNDYSGREARALLQRFVPSALGRLGGPPEQLIAFLGCTHYGYQAGLFSSLIEERVARSTLINPNRFAASDILGWIAPRRGSGTLRVRFVSPYRIPDKPLATLPRYLGKTAPATVAALRGFEHDPGLYAG
ncbi:MAG: aspartate/glutamate racemase family protein [Gammaproteobacteria bacterium]|nr:aspartate/glutamate racemase family protein [Gammaproteobacteria bacterium]NNJ79866.1 hypothetical protein [Xanthomonadales bacterium]